MNLRTLSIISYTILGIAIISITYISISRDVLKEPIGMIALSWLLLPYVVMGYGLKKQLQAIRNAMPYCILISIISISGLFMIIYTVYVKPDPQGAILVGFLPVLQLVAYVFFSFVIDAISLD